MAITPKEAGGLTRDQLVLVEQLEEYIDRQLLQRYSGGREIVSIALSRASSGPLESVSLPPGVIAELKRRYEAAGWEVKYSSDLRDGAYINLTPKNIS